MEKKLSNVLDDVDSLIETIKSSDKYKRYVIVKEELDKNQEIKEKIEMIKNLQKKIVKLKSKKEDYKKEEKEIDKILKELDNYPIYTEYNYLVDDLNYELSYIKNTIEKEIDKFIN